MSRRLLITLGALTIAVAVAGCIWVPLLMMRLKDSTADLTTARGEVTQLKQDMQDAKRTANEQRTSLRVDLSQAENERQRLVTELADANRRIEQQNAQKLAVAEPKVEDTKGDLAGKADEQPKTVQPSTTAKVDAAQPKVDAAQPKGDGANSYELVTRFDEDELYDDSGWTSLSTTAKVVTRKPVDQGSVVKSPLIEYYPSEDGRPAAEYVVPWTESVIVLPYETFAPPPIYIWP